MDPDFDDMYGMPPPPLPQPPLNMGFPPPPLPQMMFAGRYEPHTGDPAQDLAFEQLQQLQHHPQQQQQHPHRHEGHQTAGIPEEVCEFLRRFKRAILGKDVAEIHTLYEYVFPDISERYYRDRFWPDAERVKTVLGPDQDIVIILYRELYYRYLYGKIQYQDLFSYLLDCDAPRDIVLPNQWLWDMIDEFIYQFQSFCQYKANPNKRTPEELEELRKMEHDVWNLYPVLNILYTLGQKSQISEQLRAMSVGESPDDVADDFGQHQTYFKLGYFSLIGLLRLHCLLGDYNQALLTVKHLEFDPKGLYNTVRNCLVTMHYFVGFARMMQRRYMQAIQIFVDCLMYIQRTRNMMQQQQKAGYQYDLISKTNDQLYHLLAICLTLQPMRIDESIQQQLQEKCGDRMNRMSRGELAEFENTFQVGCPKFLLPQMNFEGMGNMSREPTNQQTKVFMDEIRQQITIPVIRGYLKLYSTMPVEKLASFMECSESQLVSHLLAYKHKMHVSSVPLPALASEQHSEDSTTDLDFYVDKGMIHIADTKVARRVRKASNIRHTYGEYFIRNIQKLQELEKNLHLIGTETAKR